MKRGRPKGRSRDNRSFGPLGDLIRNARLAKGLGLLEVARACGCSVQFVSNIEHGRAPLPWDKVGQLAGVLRLSVDELQAANLSIRSDFKSFVATTPVVRGRRTAKPAILSLKGTASAVAVAAKDAQLREIIQAYQGASADVRKKFARAAIQMLEA